MWLEANLLIFSLNAHLLYNYIDGECSLVRIGYIMSMSDKILILVVDMQTEVEEESYGGKL